MAGAQMCAPVCFHTRYTTVWELGLSPLFSRVLYIFRFFIAI